MNEEIKNDQVCSQILDQIFLAEQLDGLYLSLISLLETADKGELDLLLEQGNKTVKQKTLYLEKFIHPLPPTHFKTILEELISKQEFSFFSKKYFPDFLRQLQKKAENVSVIKLRLAIAFKEKDLAEMARLLSKRLGQPVALEIRIEKNLIGGAVIQHGNYISDYSLKTRLEQFRQHWQKAVVEQ